MSKRHFKIKDIRQRNDGATAVEAAMVIPAVLALLIGTMQISTAFYDISMTKNSLNNSVREILLRQDPTNSEITQIVADNIYSSGNSTISATTTFDTRYGTDFTNITANVSYPLVIPFVRNLSIDKQLKSSIAITR